MDFGFTTEQTMLRKSFSEFLSKECTHELVKEWCSGEIGYSRVVWEKMVRLGWLDLIFEKGGETESTSFLDIFILFEELGRTLLPSPLFASAVTAGMILENAGSDRDSVDLEAVVKGRKIFTAGLLNEAGRYDHENPDIKAVPDGDGGFLINGVRLFVPYADSADAVLICADVKGHENRCPTIFKVDKNTPGMLIEPMETIYAERKCRVEMKEAAVPSSAVMGDIGKGDGYIKAMLDRAMVLKCAEMLGGMKQVLNRTTEHAKTRHQFGKPLGVLQAIQHHCADMATLYEGARLIAYQAASLIDEGAPFKKEASMAKAWINKAYRKCTWIGHQIHGAVGFTEEYPLHLYYSHAKENELMFGDSRYHRAEVLEEMGL